MKLPRCLLLSLCLLVGSPAWLLAQPHPPEVAQRDRLPITYAGSYASPRPDSAQHTITVTPLGMSSTQCRSLDCVDGSIMFASVDCDVEVCAFVSRDCTGSVMILNELLLVTATPTDPEDMDATGLCRGLGGSGTPWLTSGGGTLEHVIESNAIENMAETDEAPTTDTVSPTVSPEVDGVQPTTLDTPVLLDPYGLYQPEELVENTPEVLLMPFRPDVDPVWVRLRIHPDDVVAHIEFSGQEPLAEDATGFLFDRNGPGVRVIIQAVGFETIRRLISLPGSVEELLIEFELSPSTGPR